MSLSVTDYLVVDGHVSASIQLSENSRFIIEAHTDSASLVFPSRLNHLEFLDYLGTRHDISSGQLAAVNPRNGPGDFLEDEAAWDYLDRMRADGLTPAFYRIDYDLSAAYSWTAQGPEADETCEVGLAFIDFDIAAATVFIRETGTPEVIEALSELTPHIERICSFLGTNAAI